ncbi:MAG: TonB-dependent receptor domain-containing protein, partial [Terriglobia bacterium]
PCTSGPSDGTAHLFALNLTHTVSANTVVVLTYGLTRGAAFDHSIVADYPSINPVTLLGMPSYMLRSGFPQLPSIGLSNYMGIGTQLFSYLREGQETHQALGTVTHQMGRHGFKFGGEMRVHRINFTQPGWPAGGFNFDFSGTAQSPALGPGTGGDDFASFLTGFGGSAGGEYEVPDIVSTQNFQYAAFVQDDFRVTPKLTLNLGVRYDLTLPRTERYNRMNWLDPNVLSPIQVPGLPPLHGGEMFTNAQHRTIFDTDYRDFQPRFGLAYALGSKTVLRAGYGIYYSVSRAGATGTGPIGGFQGYDEQTNWITTLNNDGATPYGLLRNPFPNGGPLLPPGSSLGLLNDVGFGASGPIPSWYSTTPYEQTWSAGFQRQIGWGVMVDASYVGKKGTHLYYGGAGELDHLGPSIEKATSAQITALNTFVNNPFFGIITDPNSPLSAPQVQASQLALPFPQFTSFQSVDPPWANSIYHAFQLRVEKRLSNGLQLLVTYTDSKSIDDSSVTGDEVSWLGSSTHLQDPNNLKLERSLSQFDIPQVLQFSYVYQLPVGRGRSIGGNLHGVADAILGGWQTNGIWRVDNGQPIAVQLLGGGQPLPTYGSQGPNVTGTLLRNSQSNWLNDYFQNPQVLVTPPPFTVSNAPRVLPNIRTPGTSNADLSLFKEFPMGKFREGMRMEYRIEASNALNHPRFCAPDTSVGSGDFGVITGQCNSPREVQMALKFYW